MQKFQKGRELMPYFKELYSKSTLSQVRRYDALLKDFRRAFKEKQVYICSSSGRVEVIGNHTDHNGGKVVGATVNLDIVAAFLPTLDGKVVVKSKGYRDIVFYDGDYEIESGSKGMVKGVMRYLHDNGYKTGGFVAYLSSCVPSGAGMSSSAAFETLVAEIQNALYNNGEITPEVKARAGQYAENVYFGKPCGLLDQGVIAVGGIVTIDFKDGFVYKKLCDELPYSLVVIDTGSSHASLTNEYASIPAEMKSIAKYFGKERLIEVDEKDFENNKATLTEKFGTRPVLRTEHFFEENKRVDTMCDELSNGNYGNFISLVNASGLSSRNKLQNCSYEGGDNKINEATDYAKSIEQNVASRVHGGGFAGTVLCAVEQQHAKQFVEKLSAKYGKDKVHLVSVRSCGTKVL